jgi:hypothetical protein
MKKLYFFAASILAAFTVSAQTVPNGGMESWRTGTSGTGPVIPIQAPTTWYGFDSTIIALGESFGPLAGFTSYWHAQLWQETTLKNSGTSSAKMMTLMQDSLGFVPGMLSSAKVNVDVPTLMAVVSAGGDPMSAITFSGGVPVTTRTRTVSAYVAYFPGKDTGTGIMGGPDTATLTVQAVSSQLGTDSVIGLGYVAIPPHSTFTQVTANVTYADTTLQVDKVRIIFASSGAGANNLDSSTLYVDDVTMTGTHQSTAGVTAVNAGSNIQVYPNPASGKLFINAPLNQQLSYTLMSATGQLVANGTVNGSTSVDLVGIASGIYYYAIRNANGVVKSGKVTVAK